jgi:hypothetical protein
MKKKETKRKTISASELVTTRAKLVGNILYYAGDEFETTDDITELAMESEEELVDRLIDILDYYYDQYQQLS